VEQNRNTVVRSCKKLPGNHMTFLRHANTHTQFNERQKWQMIQTKNLIRGTFGI